MVGDRIRASLLGLISLLTLTAATGSGTRVVTVSDVIAATVNGVPARIRVIPGANALPLLNAEIAERAKLKGGMIGAGFEVGPEVVHGSTTTARIDLGDGPVKRRIAWTKPHYMADVDGVVGPGGVAEPVVRFVLRAPRDGERTATMPMIEQSGLMSSWGERFAMIVVGGAPMRVRFDPYAPHSLITAAGGVRIATTQGGTLAGDTVPVEIAFGIKRPVRAMHLATPLPVGPLVVSHVGVRTHDDGNATGIREANADPDEILVTAKGKHDPAADRLTIGADLLARCSSIEFDKPAKVIRLSCG